MPQSRTQSKGTDSKRRQNTSSGQSDTAGRAGAGTASGARRNGNERGRRAEGGRSQRANNQRNQSHASAHQRDRDEYGTARGREFAESYEDESGQPRNARDREGYGDYDSGREQSTRGRQSGRGNQMAQSRDTGGGRQSQGRSQGQGRSAGRSGYNYQEEDFEEGGQNDAHARSRGRGSRSQYGGDNRYGRDRQYEDVNRSRDSYSGREEYDRESLERHGGYGPPSGRRDFQNSEGRGERGGQYQYEDEGDWERAGPDNYRGGDFQGGRGNRGRSDVDYYGASQYSRGGGRGNYRDEGPNWNQRYGNVNRVPAGIEDEEFAESRHHHDRSSGRQGDGRRGNGGFESARGEYANFNTTRGRDYEDSELNDYTDSRLGSTARRGKQGAGARSRQGQPGARRNTSSTSKKARSGRASR